MSGLAVILEIEKNKQIHKKFVEMGVGGKAWVLPWVLLLNLTMLLDICKWVNTLIICNLNFWLKFYMEYIGEKEQSGIL